MNKLINFEDDIFILLMKIRMIRDIMTLDADSELFMEKTLNDICFVDQTMRIIFENLEQNQHLIEREELLEQLSNAESQFSQVLSGLLEHNGNFSITGIPSIIEKIAAFRTSSQERLKTIGKLYHAEKSVNSNIYVGSDELAALLKAF